MIGLDQLKYQLVSVNMGIGRLILVSIGLDQLMSVRIV